MFRLKSLFGFGTIFDKEEETTNTPVVTGGNAAVTDGNAGGGGTAEVKKEEDKKTETHTVNVDGEDRQFTLEELKTHTSKVAASDKRFQDAATATKAAERGTRIETLVKSISKEGMPSEAEVRELAGLLAIEPGEFMQYLNEETTPQKDSTGEATVTDFNDEFKKQMGATPAEVRAILEHSQDRHVKAARAEIREISDKAVDKDSIIGKMIVGEEKDDVTLAVKDMVAEDILRKIQDGKPFGADMVAASVQRVRAQLTKLGIPNKLNQQPIVLGLAPSAGLSSVIQADEPIKRVPSTEDGDEKNLVARYLQKAVHTARKMK